MSCPHVNPSMPLPRKTVCADCHSSEIGRLLRRIADLETEAAKPLPVHAPPPRAVRAK